MCKAHYSLRRFGVINLFFSYFYNFILEICDFMIEFYIIAWIFIYQIIIIIIASIFYWIPLYILGILIFHHLDWNFTSYLVIMSVFSLFVCLHLQYYIKIDMFRVLHLT